MKDSFLWKIRAPQKLGRKLSQLKASNLRFAENNNVFHVSRYLIYLSRVWGEGVRRGGGWKFRTKTSVGESVKCESTIHGEVIELSNKFEI